MRRVCPLEFSHLTTLCRPQVDSMGSSGTLCVTILNLPAWSCPRAFSSVAFLACSCRRFLRFGVHHPVGAFVFLLPSAVARALRTEGFEQGGGVRSLRICTSRGTDPPVLAAHYVWFASWQPSPALLKDQQDMVQLGPLGRAVYEANLNLCPIQAAHLMPFEVGQLKVTLLCPVAHIAGPRSASLRFLSFAQICRRMIPFRLPGLRTTLMIHRRAFLVCGATCARGGRQHSARGVWPPVSIAHLVHLSSGRFLGGRL